MGTPDKSKGGRPRTTHDTPLTEVEQRYVDAIRAGKNMKLAYRLSGAPLETNASHAQLRHRIVQMENKPNVAAQLLTVRAETNGTFNPEVTAHVPEVVTREWLNQQIMIVHRSALSSEDYTQSLKALAVLAELNEVGPVKRLPGRPKVNKEANRGDTSGNYGDSADEQVSEKGAGTHSFFDDLDDDDGAEPAPGYEVVARVASERESSKPRAKRGRPPGPAKRSPGSSGEDGGGVS